MRPLTFANAAAGGNTIALPEHCSSELKRKCATAGAVENSEDETSHRGLHLLER